MNNTPPPPIEIHRIADFRAEVFAALLADNNIPFAIKRKGGAARPHNRDILTVEEDFVDYDKSRIIITTPREGVYDYLPEGVFHSPSLGTPDKGVNTIVDEMRAQKTIEAEARLFFTPFEEEALFVEVQDRQYENRLEKQKHHTDLVDILTPLWNILPSLEQEEARTFVHILPLINTQRGMQQWLATFIASFLQVPVIIKNETVQVKALPFDQKLNGLNECSLGIDTILWGDYRNGNKSWNIQIGPVAHHSMYKFLPGSSFNELLQQLYAYFIAKDIEVRQSIYTKAEGNGFILQQSFLGYTTFL